MADLPADVLDEIAADAGEDKDLLRWWQEIATDPARAELAALRPTLVEVYQVLRDHGPVTDDDLNGLLQWGRGIRSASPRRNELTKLGLVRSPGRTDAGHGRAAKLWEVVPHQEIAKARAEAKAQGLRRKHLDKYTLEEQLQIVHYLVRKPMVNEALLADHRNTVDAKHARREARAAQQDEERRRREWADRIKQAERDASPDLNFLKAVRELRLARDKVRELGRVISENIQSIEVDGVPFIHPDRFVEVRAEVRELVGLAKDIDDDLTGLIGDEEESDVITVEPLDDDEGWELCPGSTDDE